MPVILHQFTTPSGAPHQPGYDIAKLAALNCAEMAEAHRRTLAGGATGLAAGSCWAAVAMAAPGEPGFTFVFGASKMAQVLPQAHGLFLLGAPPEGYSSHAEKNALLTADHQGDLYEDAHGAYLYVQLSPCLEQCDPWLRGQPPTPGSHLNPYAAAVQGNLQIHAWYRWPHPGGVGDMVQWNRWAYERQATDITGW